ncbi:MAG: SDR family NAD(P)-dependent oxidoreductase [Candidatus Marinimicrobia bacterium]|nr:SDR family NAD(P)-dependent oxidoreductase [Candidatus Neomarinimicrobiota bacterium]
MNVLVLGASSSIGSSIVKSFAKNNKLFLLSTKCEKLETLKKETLALRCQSVKIIESDLQSPIIVKDLILDSIDIIINVACTSSRLKNLNIVPNQHKSFTEVDLSNPLVILEHFLEEKAKQGKNAQLYYIFINTILSKIKSPDYSIYYSYKILQQEYVNGFQRKYCDILKSINVIVGTQIDRTKETRKTVDLAKRIKLAIEKNESEFIYGFEGKLIYMLYRVSPLLSNILIYIKRLLFKS